LPELNVKEVARLVALLNLTSASYHAAQEGILVGRNEDSTFINPHFHAKYPSMSILSEFVTARL
jgi:hypothetical protein